MTYERGCCGCPYCVHLHDQMGWWFYGCTCPPYRGKWIAEITKCPNEEKYKEK